MPKRIAFLADGTWQLPLNNTNVYRLYKALSTTTADQVAFYDDGIGADAAGLSRVLQGAFGEGLIQKIIDGYSKIAHAYQPGDEIYLFGFSRGAYTARSLAGMIAACGLPSGGVFTDDCITQILAAYRDPVNRAQLLGALTCCTLADATIRMVGVWDTVGSLGIPALTGQIDQQQYGFLSTTLHPDIKSAYQALAIDEVRPQFPATLWDPLPTPAQLPAQLMEQVWFSGCHGDVGGGTPASAGPGNVDQNTRLSDITMGWMLAKAQLQGLTFDPGIAAQYATLPQEFALDRIHASWLPADGPQHLRTIPADAVIANSVPIRIQYALTYTPGNLKIEDSALAATYPTVQVVGPN